MKKTFPLFFVLITFAVTHLAFNAVAGVTFPNVLNAEACDPSEEDPPGDQ